MRPFLQASLRNMGRPSTSSEFGGPVIFRAHDLPDRHAPASTPGPSTAGLASFEPCARMGTRPATTVVANRGESLTKPAWGGFATGRSAASGALRAAPRRSQRVASQSGQAGLKVRASGARHKGRRSVLVPLAGSRAADRVRRQVRAASGWGIPSPGSPQHHLNQGAQNA